MRKFMANGAAMQKFEVREEMPQKGSSVLQITNWCGSPQWGINNCVVCCVWRVACGVLCGVWCVCSRCSTVFNVCVFFGGEMKKTTQL